MQIDANCMLNGLYTFCEINSGSTNLTGLKRMHDMLKAQFSPWFDTVESHALPPVTQINLAGETITQEVGPLLYFKKRPELKRRVLLCGHMDTVFGANHPFQTLTPLGKTKLNGPGVADMKGGLLVMQHGFMAFEKTSAAKTLGVDVIITADEELGSLASRAFLETIRDDYQAALVYEPATTPDGKLAKNRKGAGKFTLIATGKSAHAGRDFKSGRNAITHLSKALLAVDAINQNDRNITLNIGQIQAGEALNQVPDKAVLKFEVRIITPEDQTWVFDKLHKVIEDLKHPDYHLHLDGGFTRPPKRINPATQSLFERLQTLGKQQGLTLDWQDTGGCCDGNNLAEKGLAVLDTLGVCGGNIHTQDEFLIIESLASRATLTAQLLEDLALGGLEALASA